MALIEVGHERQDMTGRMAYIGRVPEDHPETAITIRLEEANSPNPIAHITKERSVLQGLRFTRPQLARAKKLPELARPGVYFLWAYPEAVTPDGEQVEPDLEPESAPKLSLYIGCSDDPSHRFIDHESSNKFPDWTDACVFSTANIELDATQANYVEVCLIERAAPLETINRFSLVNTQGVKKAKEGKPLKYPKVNEGQRAEAEYFLREVLMVLPLLGITAFRDPQIQESETDGGVEFEGSSEVTQEKLRLKPSGTDAHGVQRDDGFLVFEASRGKREIAPLFKPPQSAAVVRQELLDEGILVEDGTHVVLTKDWLFSSPSAAASVLAGGSKSGSREWENGEGKTLGEILDG